MVEETVENVFQCHPEIIYGYADLSYSPFFAQYPTALVFAVPFGDTGRVLENGKKITGIDFIIDQAEQILEELHTALSAEHVLHQLPPEELDEVQLQTPFSYKYAAVRAGLGWIGKNDVLVTEKYGPRIRLAVLFLGEKCHYGHPVTVTKCPEKCTDCVDACPHHVLYGTPWNLNRKRMEMLNCYLCDEKRLMTEDGLILDNSCNECVMACPHGISGQVVGFN